MDTAKSVKRMQLWLQSFQNTTDVQTVAQTPGNMSMAQLDI